MDMSWKVESAIDNLVAATDRKVCAEIDAGCCRTSRDWDRAHQRQDEAMFARESLEKAIRTEIQHTIEMTEKRVRAQVKKEFRERLAALV